MTSESAKILRLRQAKRHAIERQGRKAAEWVAHMAVIMKRSNDAFEAMTEPKHEQRLN